MYGIELVLFIIILVVWQFKPKKKLEKLTDDEVRKPALKCLLQIAIVITLFYFLLPGARTLRGVGT